MKCPVCQAQLLPVDGEMFCLQCGEAVNELAAPDEPTLKLEDTRDPLLRRAISDATDGVVTFVNAAASDSVRGPLAAPIEPVAVSPPAGKPKHTFASLRSILSPPRPAMTQGAMMMPPAQVMSAVATVAGPAPAAVAPSAPAVGTVPVARAKAARDSRLGAGMIKAWVIGVAGLVAFVGANFAVGNYFSNRVYPGARVGNVAVGGWTFDELHLWLPQRLARPTMAAVVSGRHYDIDVSLLGSPNYPEVEQNLKQMGRSTALPLVGVVSSWLSKPVTPEYELSDEGVGHVVERLKAAVDRQASDAGVMMLGSSVLVLAEKPGLQLDPVATTAALKAAYGRVATASLEPVRIAPTVTAAAYANEVAVAQTLVGLGIQVTIKKAKYSPTPEQIAGWLVFSGPGKGVSVNAAGVAAYVASIPGSFDRAGTVTAITTALNNRQAAAVSPSTVHVTANPQPANTAAGRPVATYNYCVDEAEPGSGLVEQAAAVLGTGGVWTFAGRVQFTRAMSGCNFVLRLADAQTMKSLDPACEQQTACRIHNDLAIAKDAWEKAPAGWAGSLASYRAELVTHVAGQWLGFDHASCNAAKTQSPVLSAPSVVIPGCSPSWYAVPVELQDTKVLAGF